MHKALTRDTYPLWPAARAIIRYNITGCFKKEQEMSLINLK